MLNWIEKHKNDDNIFIHFLRMIYLIAKAPAVPTVVCFVAGILIPIMGENKHYVGATLFALFAIGVIMLGEICRKHEKKQYRIQIAKKIEMQQIGSVFRSFRETIQQSPNWKGTIFKTISNAVCVNIHDQIQSILGCETRISVEYIFCSSKSKKKKLKILARHSPNGNGGKKSFPMSERQNYFSYRIFTKKADTHILFENEIENENIWFQNPNTNTKVYQYWGIAKSVKKSEEVAYILQIDFLEPCYTFSNKKEVQAFINRHFCAYLSALELAYCLNLDSSHNIPEM